ncbi:HIT domain-containing protein [Candidatus Nomurabacteria bacterium]|nr:HIT domain-containing protein [Candidatus Nomurabacteria bacterium]
MKPSIFTKIINGEIPSHKVYEDEKTLAFLDIHPVQPGHTLVIPKSQVEFLWDLESDDYAAVMATTKVVATRLRDVFGVPYVGAKVEGVEIPHAHVHLIPFSAAEEYKAVADMTTEPDHEFLASIAEKIRFQ